MSGPADVDLRAFVPVVAALLVVTRWHVATIGTAALSQRPLPSWLATLPAIPVLDRAPLYGHIGVHLSAFVELLSLGEAGLLAALVLVTRGRGLGRGGAIVTVAAVAVLIATVLAARGMLSGDVYAYIGDGILGLHAYAPPSAPFAGALRAINHLWGDPLLACTYGPTWLYPATLLTHGVADPAAGLLRFRLAGIASILAVAACLVRSRAALPVILVFTLNPTIWLQYGVDAHNDLWPVALIFIGRLWANRTLVAIAFGGLAGAAKVPFLIACVVIGADRKTLRERVVIGGGSVALGLLLSGVLGGNAYLSALESVRHAYATPLDAQSLGVRLLAIIGTLIALANAVAARRFAWPAAFTFSGLGYGIFPWYAAWGLPYATLGAGMELFLCALPISAFIMATTYAATPLWLPLLAAVGVCCGVYAYALARHRLLPAMRRPANAAPLC